MSVGRCVFFTASNLQHLNRASRLICFPSFFFLLGLFQFRYTFRLWTHFSFSQFLFHERRWMLERKLASSDVPKEEQINLIKDLERKETEFMRLKRHKICVDDFELLTIIGRGAFGEVSLSCCSL